MLTARGMTEATHRAPVLLAQDAPASAIEHLYHGARGSELRHHLLELICGRSLGCLRE